MSPALPEVKKELNVVIEPHEAIPDARTSVKGAELDLDEQIVSCFPANYFASDLTLPTTASLRCDRIT